MNDNPDKELRRSFRRHMRRKRWKANKSALKGFFKLNRKGKTSNRSYGYGDYSRQESKLARINRNEEKKKALKTLLQRGEYRVYFLRTISISTAASIINFFALYIFYQVSTITISGFFSIPMGWSHFRFTYPLSSGSPLYTKIAIITVFLTPPLLCFILGLLCRTFLKRSTSRLYWIFIQWFSIHGTNFFFGAIISGILTRTEMIYATTWFFMSSSYDIIELMLIIISITALMIIGYWFSYTAFFIPKPKVYREKGYQQINLFTEIVIPYMGSIIVIIAISYPSLYLPYIIKVLSTLLIMIPLIARYQQFSKNVVA
jgi:hypothetical protein